MDKKIQQQYFKRIQLVDDELDDERLDESMIEILNQTISKLAENEMKMLKEMLNLNEQLNPNNSDDKELWLENSFIFNV